MDFQIVSTDIDETPIRNETAIDYVVRLASSKAGLESESLKTGTIILAADTTVAYDDQILGKPDGSPEAMDMLKLLRGKTHQVYSGIAISSEGNLLTDVCSTDVPMRLFSDEEIRTYVASGDPLDKAGAYAIQNSSFHPVEGLSGCYANVMGLPLCNLVNVLKRFDIILETEIPDSCQEFTGYKCPVYHEILFHPEN